MRREARSGEIDAITKAKAVLSGADYALLQTGAFLAPRGHRRPHHWAHFHPPHH